LYGNNTNTVLDSAGSANLILQTGGATRATLTSTATTLTGTLTLTSTDAKLLLNASGVATQKSLIASNGGASVNYNGLYATSNWTDGNAQANSGLSSWRVDVGGFDAFTFGSDQFAVGRAPAGSTTFSKLFTVTSNGNVSIAATTASTSTSSGALVVSGGVGVAGAIYAGGDIITTKSNGVIKASGSSANAEVSAQRLTTTPSSVSMVAAVSQPQLAFTSDTAGSYTWGRILANSSEIVRVHSANLTAIANVAGAGIAVAGGIINTGSLTTGAPSGGTAAAWKLGTVATVSPTSPNRTIEVDIGGTIYYIHAKTTNN
jgi:hypothetical protein